MILDDTALAEIQMLVNDDGIDLEIDKVQSLLDTIEWIRETYLNGMAFEKEE